MNVVDLCIKGVISIENKILDIESTITRLDNISCVNIESSNVADQRQYWIDKLEVLQKELVEAREVLDSI